MTARAPASIDLGLSRGERLLGLGSLTGNASLRACKLGLRGLDQMPDDLGSVRRPIDLELDVSRFLAGFRRTARFLDVDIIYVRSPNYLYCRRLSLAKESVSGGY